MTTVLISENQVKNMYRKRVRKWNQGMSSEAFEILNGIAPRKPKDPNIDPFQYTRVQ